MICRQCGEQAQGTFCSHCGTRLVEEPEKPARNWADDLRFEVVVRHPEVRELILHHFSQSRQRMSGEAFLELFDTILKPQMGVSLVKLAAILQPIYGNLGLKTGKTRAETIAAPAGKVLVAVLCSLARRGQQLESVEQRDDGCLLKAQLPSDLWSFAGDFWVSVQRREAGIQVEAATVIKGQMFDWGKSKRMLATLFKDIEALTRPGQGN